MDDLIKALKIFRMYDNSYAPLHCEHDVLRVCVDPSQVSAKDLETLDDIGFFPDEDYEYFMSYRYGSC